MHDAEPDQVGVHHLGTEKHTRPPPGGVAVLVLDPADRGRIGDPPEMWTALADNVRVLWLHLISVEDPLIHARALLERQVDRNIGVYVVTGREAEHTALLVAAHRVDAVAGVFVAGDGSGSDDAALRDVLAAHGVPVWPIEARGSNSGGAVCEQQPLDSAEVLEALIRELLERDVRASPAVGDADVKATLRSSLTAEAVTVFTDGLTALLHRAQGTAVGQRDRSKPLDECRGAP